MREPSLSGDTLLATVWHFLDSKGLASEAWLVALDRSTGRELSRVVLPSSGGGVLVQGAPGLSGRLAIVTTRGGDAYGIDRFTGQITWHHVANTQHATDAQVEVMDDAVYIDGGDGSVYALRASDGSVIWRSEVQAELTCDLLVTTDRVIAVSGAFMFLLDRSTGKPLLTITQPHTAESSSLFASPAAASAGHVFIAVNGAAWSFDPP